MIHIEVKVKDILIDKAPVLERIVDTIGGFIVRLQTGFIRQLALHDHRIACGRTHQQISRGRVDRRHLDITGKLGLQGVLPGRIEADVTDSSGTKCKCHLAGKIGRGGDIGRGAIRCHDMQVKCSTGLILLSIVQARKGQRGIRGIVVGDRTAGQGQTQRCGCRRTTVVSKTGTRCGYITGVIGHPCIDDVIGIRNPVDRTSRVTPGRIAIRGGNRKPDCITGTQTRSGCQHRVKTIGNLDLHRSNPGSSIATATGNGFKRIQQCTGSRCQYADRRKIQIKIIGFGLCGPDISSHIHRVEAQVRVAACRVDGNRCSARTDRSKRGFGKDIIGGVTDRATAATDFFQTENSHINTGIKISACWHCN